MGDGGLVALLLEIVVDPSKGEAALAQMRQSISNFAEGMGGVNSQLAASADAAAKHFTAGADETSKALLSNHQSVHLLAEEMGIHLPRAVAGAVSEMLPTIQALGGALLAVFAVKEVYHFAEAGADALRKMFTEADEDIKTLDAAAAAFKHASAETAALLTQFKTSLAGTFNLAEIDARAAQLERYHNAYKLLMDTAGGDLRVLGTIDAEAVAVIAAASRQGMNDLASVDKKLNETGQLQMEAHKRMAEVTKNEAHALCEAAIHDNTEATRVAHQAAEVARRIFEDEKLMHAWHFKAMAEAGKALAADSKALETAAKDQEFLNKASLDFLHILDDISGVEQRQAALARSAAPGAQTLPDPTTLKHLSQATTVYVAALQRMHQEADAAKNALGGMASATIQAGVAAAMSGENIGKAMAQALKSTLTSISSEASVRALYNLGLGLYYEAIQDYPDADLAFSASAVFGSIGALSGLAGAAIPGGSRSGRSGGPGGNQASYGSSPGSSGGSGPGGGGGGSRGPTIVLQQYGPMVGTMNDLAKALVTTINQLGTSGQVRLTAYNSLTNGAKQT